MLYFFSGKIIVVTHGFLKKSSKVPPEEIERAKRSMNDYMRKKIKERRFFSDRLKEDLKNPKFRKAYEAADLPVQLAIQIAKLRQKKKLTQKALARRLGTQQQVISRIENFEESNLTLATLGKIAQALNVHLRVAFY